MAEIANYYFINDSDHVVSAFTVDGEYLKEDMFCNKPTIAFEDVLKIYPIEDNYLFIALSYSKTNSIRKEKFNLGKSMGYSMASYISTKSSIMSDDYGENCFILEDNTIQPFVSIGNNVTMWSGNHIGHHSKVGDHCFISSHVVVSGGVTIGESCFLGVNATLRDHITIGESCVIGAGATILSDAEPNGVYVNKETERSKIPSSRLRKI